MRSQEGARKSDPEYWCDYCEVLFKGTQLGIQQHEATSRHQGNFRNSVKGLKHKQGNEHLDQEQKKAEVARRSSLNTTSTSLTDAFSAKNPSLQSKKEVAKMKIAPKVLAHPSSEVSLRELGYESNEVRSAESGEESEEERDSSFKTTHSPSQRSARSDTDRSRLESRSPLSRPGITPLRGSVVGRRRPQTVVVEHPSRQDKVHERTSKADLRKSVSRPPLVPPGKFQSGYDTLRGHVIVESHSRRDEQQYHRVRVGSEYERNYRSVGGDEEDEDEDEEEEEEEDEELVSLVARRHRDIGAGSRRRRQRSVEIRQADAEDYINARRAERKTSADQSVIIANKRPSRAFEGPYQTESSRSRSRSRSRNQNHDIRMRIGNDIWSMRSNVEGTFGPLDRSLILAEPDFGHGSGLSETHNKQHDIVEASLGGLPDHHTSLARAVEPLQQGLSRYSRESHVGPAFEAGTAKMNSLGNDGQTVDPLISANANTDTSKLRASYMDAKSLDRQMLPQDKHAYMERLQRSQRQSAHQQREHQMSEASDLLQDASTSRLTVRGSVKQSTDVEENRPVSKLLEGTTTLQRRDIEPVVKSLKKKPAGKASSFTSHHYFTKGSPDVVDDSGLSYLTNENSRKNSRRAFETADWEDKFPGRGIDLLVIKHNGVFYPIQFPAQSIYNGNLKIGDIRQKAAKSLGIGKAHQIVLFSKGCELEFDERTAREEWLRGDGSDSQILAVLREVSELSPGKFGKTTQSLRQAIMDINDPSSGASDASQPPTSVHSLNTKEEATNAGDLDDDSESNISSYASSVFSVASLASAATDLSRASGYSVIQIAAATRELVSIFQEDDSFVLLYRIALELPSIGPERLQRNLRRLFKAYAEYLKEEAKDQLEFSASRLVSMKAQYLAQCIVAKYNVRSTGIVQVQLTDQPDVSSEDEEVDKRPVDEKVFEDLVSFREFLVESDAFKKLRSQLNSFILPNEQEPSLAQPPVQSSTSRQQNLHLTNTTNPERSWQTWFADVRRLVDAVFIDSVDIVLARSALSTFVDALWLSTDALFVRFGLLEPPLIQNATRLRWTSRRGDHIFSDVVEYSDDSVGRLLPHLERSTGAKVTAASYNRQTGNQQYIAPHPIQWIQNGLSKLTTSTSKATGPCIPLHNSRGATAAAATTSSSTPPTPSSLLHLLACMHRDRSRKVLQQDLLENINTDRQLFKFMQQQYIQHRGRFRNMLSFKSVQGIFLVKFSLPSGKTVIVREHNSYCTANATHVDCQCIPPAEFVEPSQNAQYRCVPGPPDFYPPIPSEHLLLLFSHPDDADEDDDWILKQLPRRLCGKLQGQPGQPAEGWGVYYQEGWDRDLISVVIFSVFLVASALFGALWSVFKFDIQGAFGISAYMVAVCAALIPLIAMGVDKPR